MTATTLVQSHDPFQPGYNEPAEDEPPAELQVPAGSIKVVLEWVGDDAARATAALEAEQAAAKPRVSLIEQLTALAAAAEDEPPAE